MEAHVDVLSLAVGLAIVSNRLVEAFVKPILNLIGKYVTIEDWLQDKILLFSSWIVGGLLGWLAQLNIFTEWGLFTPEVGLILTAIAIGGGANLLHDIIKAFSPPIES